MELSIQRNPDGVSWFQNQSEEKVLFCMIRTDSVFKKPADSAAGKNHILRINRKCLVIPVHCNDSEMCIRDREWRLRRS